MNKLMSRPQDSDAIQKLEVLNRSDGNVDLEQSLERVQGDDRAIAKAYFSQELGLDYTRYSGFSQEAFYDYTTTASVPTIRFTMPNDGYWEKFIGDTEKIGKKFRFKSGYNCKGLAWQDDRLDVTKINQIYIVEGIFDALALMEHGISAISAMSANNFPKQTLIDIFQLNPNLAIVIALNTDKRGLKSVNSWIEKCKAIGFKTISVAITNDEDTWNDKHKKNALKPEDIEEYLYNGSLLMAESVLKKAYLIHEHNNVNQFIFEFDNKTYWIKRDEKQKESESHDPLAIFQSEYQIIEIANCTFTFLYAQKMLGSNDLSYFIEVSTDRNRNVAALSSKQLSSAGEFKTTVMNIIAGATFTGETKNLDALYKLKTTNIYNIEATNFMGYAEEFGAYIFKDFAVYKGVVYKANQHEYIELPNNIRVKTTFHLPDFNPVMHYQNDWWDDYLDVFGVKGVAVLAYWFGSLFAEQIRSVYKAYPFLELTGDPSSGKSMILRFLWSLLGRHDYEGANPNLGTENNYLRTLAQVGNLPVVMIECEGFSLENLKAAFNGGILRATAKKDLSNETYSPKFRTVLIICQNDRVITLGSKFNQEALLSRMISVAFDKTRHTPERAVKARRLELLSVEDVSGFLIASLKLELQVMRVIQSTFETNRQRIMDLGIKEGRIGLTHGLMLSLVDALSLIVPLNQSVKNEVFTYIDQIALERDLELKQDHPMLEQFWDVYDNLSAQNYPVNHACDPKMIAINLTQFYALATEHRYQLDDMREVKKLLPTSTRYKFIAKNKETYSRFYTNKTSTKASRIVRAYVFQKLDQE
ncbi:hypothetical protein B9T13_07765 [Wohlfahrtiimonas chitiniclastica]|uniref:toprim domain-containing protein n=1 Tax=Wohlfahrtiimonas chitiniclastica TaxID=400946 RepID=UPI000B99321A|nr:toprim domain-containing protein [Wohlfahrtiimonas chitiniclastica]OYQ69451.1 hypothetical protein B9T13_07765 [Wohlfahrtiimonas chitiniclastica]